jgi:hypothetical protein
MSCIPPLRSTKTLAQYMTAYNDARAFARRGQRRMVLCFAAGGLCGTALSGSAVANPPLSGGKPLLATLDSVRPAPAASSRFVARQENAPALQLDLRPPMGSMPAPALARGPVALAFNSDNDAEDPPRTGFGTGEARFPMMSRQETWLHRVHREGVPIVRLWNSKAALLSIGLNQKGKPGLWLIQKVH